MLSVWPSGNRCCFHYCCPTNMLPLQLCTPFQQTKHKTGTARLILFPPLLSFSLSPSPSLSPVPASLPPSCYPNTVYPCHLSTPTLYDVFGSCNVFIRQQTNICVPLSAGFLSTPSPSALTSTRSDCAQREPTL